MPFMEGVTTYVYGLIGLMILMAKEIHDEFFPKKYLFFENPKPVIGAFASALLVALILSIGVFDGSQFIYFQF